MAVLIGSARSSFGHTEAGDQSNGREVSTQSWYLHSKGWIVLRPKRADHAAKLAEAMRAACANDRIGYDQSTRGTLYTAVKGKGYDPARCTTKVNTDCSALVRVCCCYAGIMVANFTTINEVSVLMATGMFDKLTDAKYTTSSAYLCAGDILVTRTKGHTVIVLTDGAKAAKRSATAYTSNRTARVRATVWNIRPTAGMDDAPIGTVQEGELLTVIGEAANGWLNVVTPSGRTGWISPKGVDAVG